MGDGEHWAEDYHELPLRPFDRQCGGMCPLRLAKNHFDVRVQGPFRAIPFQKEQSCPRGFGISRKVQSPTPR